MSYWASSLLCACVKDADNNIIGLIQLASPGAAKD